MILTKGKHNFWSQLLVSMIAIFALPDVQVADRINEYSQEYQNQSNQQQVLRAIYQIKQQNLSLTYPAQPTVIAKKFVKFTPHFMAKVFAEYAPIRGSPFA
ncbi:DUF2547 family protein [Lonepinella koalarum]|uniref:Uncharacterized protein DUF2547 n=1 Tax=Lonepinella koalarum TaxID=53417 RepID=A0A4R1KWH4_9PAST|nr:secA translation cis-regulator SecM [Lonepinella koalarum]MDH2926540.1 hypothetical protein [Lonepinella koalarum]TCK69524.1 uncharacterized protein DUF2547 [Lonepinella koalarum]TFJ89769.1 DUF2547 family protein [Lonepinella koalarum]TYG34041.1 DUF2547 family protein [Lonepinella koalarum]